MSLHADFRFDAALTAVWCNDRHRWCLLERLPDGDIVCTCCHESVWDRLTEGARDGIPVAA